MGLGAGSCPQGARASTSDLRPSRTRATGAHSPRRLTRRSYREPSAAPSERWRTDRPQDARLRPRRRAHAVPVDDTSSSARSARVQAPRPLRMAHLLSSQPQAERLQVSRPQLSVTPAISGAAARRSGGRGSNPTSRDRAVLGVVDCSTRAWFVPAWWAHRCEAPRARRRALETSFRPTPMARRAQLFGAGLLRVCRVCRAKCKVGALGQESRRAVLCVCVCGEIPCRLNWCTSHLTTKLRATRSPPPAPPLWPLCGLCARAPALYATVYSARGARARGARTAPATNPQDTFYEYT